MKEKHMAYKISKNTTGLVCTHSEFEADKMVDLLKEIRAVETQDIYWIFKQREGKPEEALCIIDCEHNRIYYHYSGEVDDIDSTLKKLNSINAILKDK